ncbi:tRNA (adenosine(37)-N6)-dimethylallyltransferase MiaA [Pseudoteredinibacter isoporae]|uniref:tRNA dimethylallyltransferase n=1 Tax=Pseudoteredinibacter isoporae TaxID=570281 RepID=A0A7X0JQZ0_9GAMM|nr:tRNA (adenosine(37)-N6)-dimethylallyltransferase MiaA [Pseudoteredinibacter isoporae]MBB6520674.1 tRNA dimethylallyltransferase [Pseudoteredinibacter isoporae]NHO86241.1 tRNA (adenosine(37)-N6)-dimethylallyltransferase MiaA [Pseudoteredinibacter isoporae]NIB25308.1 tRNA (adenosine(37)-N6)-dimethylallyltransferase MiaA [Pseudoteredinibacter isoporae]
MTVSIPTGDSNLSNVIFLLGPTASGKTALALEIAKQLPVEIISVDSALVYRGMDIGSAKPSAEELAQVPHHLIDIRDPAEPYSAADFRVDAEALVEDILARGKTPLLVGGTMLYFKALLDGMADMPAADAAVRMEIEQLAEKEGWPAVHAELAKVDPETAAAIHPNHSQRLSRALEVYRSSGKTMSELRRQQQAEQREGFSDRYRVLQMAIAPHDRALLHRRIEQRYHAMIDQGLLDEVKAMHCRADLHVALPSARAVGYRQIWQYLDGELSLDEAVEKAIVATRQLAKRQLTWLRGWSELNWVYIDKEDGQLLREDEIISQAMGFIGRKDI